MGLTDKITELVSGDEEEELDDMLAEDVEDEDLFEEEDEGVFEEEIEEEEGGVQEWDDPYDFVMSHLTESHFADGSELSTKVMAYDIDRSSKYRDRIKSGMSTIDAITDTMSELEELRSGGSGKTNWEEKADQLEAANTVIDQTDKLSGKEDELIDEGLSIAGEFVDTWKDSIDSDNASRDVDTSVNETQEEL